MIDCAAVVRFAGGQDKPLFEFRAAESVADIRRAAGSVYQPVELSGVLQEILRAPERRWAVAGVPCLCTAVRRAVGKKPALARSIPYVLGLACGMYQNVMYTELLLAESGVKTDETVAVRYRVKDTEGPPGDFCFVATRRDGSEGRPIPYRGLPLFLGRNGYFRLDACNFCRDVFAGAADACFMDAWLPEYARDPRGTSLVVIRNAGLEALVAGGVASGDLVLAPVTAGDVARSQQGALRRKWRLARTRTAFGVSHRPQHAPRISLSDMLSWHLNRWTQRRSKAAWRYYGRRHGPTAFWLSIADLLLLQSVLMPIVMRLESLVARFVGLLKRSPDSSAGTRQECTP